MSGHHIVRVGSGGVDEDGEVPLCGEHHHELEQVGLARFEKKYWWVDVERSAKRYLEKWERRRYLHALEVAAGIRTPPAPVAALSAAESDGPDGLEESDQEPELPPGM